MPTSLVSAYAKQQSFAVGTSALLSLHLKGSRKLAIGKWIQRAVQRYCGIGSEGANSTEITGLPTILMHAKDDLTRHIPRQKSGIVMKTIKRLRITEDKNR